MGMNGTELVVGLERWLTGLGPWTDSAADHELTHCRQEFESGLLTQRWNPRLTMGGYFRLWAQAEVPAVVLNPLWPFSVVVLFVFPLIAQLVPLVDRALSATGH